MQFAVTERDRLIECLPKGLVCAEVGVAWGAFSEIIHKTVSPKVLHLIDPWVHQAREDYKNDLNNVGDNQQEKRYRDLLEKYKDVPEVAVIRDYSLTRAALYPNAFFDFVYIDAMHTHDAVIADLEAFAQRMKPDGLMFGHDFASHPHGRKMNFGVIGGVVEFIKRSGWQILALTSEPYATYVLARRGELSGTAAAFMGALLRSNIFMLELPDEIIGNFSHKTLTSQGKVVRTLPSFRL